MKKILSLFLAVTMILSVFSLAGSAGTLAGVTASSAPKQTASVKHVIPAKGSCGTGVAFTYDSVEKVLRIRSINSDFYYGTDQYSVWGNSPFSYSDVKEVIFEDYFRNIGSYMFAGCQSLQKVTLPAALLTIGSGAFDTCHSLKQVAFPDGLKTIGERAFAGVPLSQVCLPDTVKSIGMFAFEGAQMEELELKGALSNVPAFAFGDCTKLKKAVLPETVKDIAAYAFSNCSELKDLTIPSAATIHSYSFEGCEKMESITYTYGAGRMQDFSPFMDNEKLHVCYTPQFINNATLKRIVVEEGVDYIGAYAFDQFRSSCMNRVLFKGFVKEFGQSDLQVVDNLVMRGEEYVISAIGAASTRQIVFGEQIEGVCSFPLEGFEKLERVAVLGEQTDISRILSKLGTNVSLYLYAGSKAQAQAEEKGVPYTLIDGNCSATGNHLISIEPEYLQAPDCTHGGEAVYRCIVCGEEMGRESLVALSHDYHFTGSTEPGCTTTGERSYTCARCGEKHTEEIPATGHNLKRWPVNEIESTCKKEGLCYWYCQGENCNGYYEKRAVPKKAHNYAAKVVAPTCVHAGYTLHTCTVCGDAYKDSITPMVAHQPGEAVIRNRTAATCEAEGGFDEVGFCTLCHKELSRQHHVLARLEHRYSNRLVKADLTKNGSLLKVCFGCGKIASEARILRPSAFKLSQSRFVYTRSSHVPRVCVLDSSGKVLKQGTDYTVQTPRQSMNVGRYTLKVVFCGKYKGTKQLSYDIVPNAVPITTVKTGKTTATVCLKKQTAQIDGYQIRYARSSSFADAKTVTVTNRLATARTIRSLQRNSVYYFQVRTFKTVDKVNYFSTWSKAYKAKTK